MVTYYVDSSGTEITVPVAHLDTDKTPFFDATGTATSTSYPILTDSDGVPYYATLGTVSIGTVKLIAPDAIWSVFAPENPYIGMIWVDTSDPHAMLVKYWNGEEWIAWALLGMYDIQDSSQLYNVWDNKDGRISVASTLDMVVIDNGDGTATLTSPSGLVADIGDGQVAIANF